MRRRPFSKISQLQLLLFLSPSNVGSRTTSALAFVTQHLQAQTQLQRRSLGGATPSTTATMAAAAKTNEKDKDDPKGKRKPRILCLHGKYQSGAIFANKIAGARRKLERSYDLDFLDGPIRLPSLSTTTNKDTNTNGEGQQDNEEAYFAWWLKDETTGEHTLVQEGFDYVLEYIEKQQQSAASDDDYYQPYQAIIGFSQGGLLATALCCSNQMPSIKAVVTAGSPMVEEAFRVAESMAANTGNGDNADKEEAAATAAAGYQVPKLHLAGETDAMISVASTQALCQRGGHGRLEVHDQGHLFPTRSARVQTILEFLQQHITSP